MKAATKSTAKKAEAKKQPKAKPRKLDAYMQKKVAAQRKHLPVGKRVVYRGHGVDRIAGKPGVVTKHESRGGVFIRVGDKTLVVSPFALLPGHADAKK